MERSRTPIETAHPTGAALRLEGRDTLAVLHRISSAALEDLAPGEARATLFLDHRGRLLHRAAVARGRDGAVWLVRADAPAGDLLAHVEKHVFREDVRAAESAPAVIQIRFGAAVERGDFEEGGGPSRITLASGETLTWPADTPPFDDRARIRAGLPRHGFEIRDAFHPFEVGLAAEVHLSKGCYTGQEVLQRLVTYDSVRRRLVRLSGDGTPPAPDAPVLAGEAKVGVVTSAAIDGSGWIALAVMKRDAVGGEVRIEGTEGTPRVEPVPEARPQGLP